MRRRAPRLNRPARFEPPQPTDLDPRPVTQRRGTPLPPHTKSVTAPTNWAPRHGSTPTWRERAAAVVDYAIWLAGRADLLVAARTELAGANLACFCPTAPCHRDVLLDIANPPTDPQTAGGRTVGLTLRRPWASLLLVPHRLGGIHLHPSSFTTDYRGPVAIFAGTRIAETGQAAATTAGLDSAWHTRQTGWLGAAVLIDIHPARAHCCRSRFTGRPVAPDRPLYHWVFADPARLALPTFGRGFVGLRPVSWSVLVRRSALRLAQPEPSPLDDILLAGLRWLHDTAQPDTAIIDPYAATAHTPHNRLIRFVPLGWGWRAAIIIEIASIEWSTGGAPLQPLTGNEIALTAATLELLGTGIHETHHPPSPLCGRISLTRPAHPSLIAAVQRYRAGCPIHHSTSCGHPNRPSGARCDWYTRGQRGVIWPFNHTGRPADPATTHPKDTR